MGIDGQRFTGFTGKVISPSNKGIPAVPAVPCRVRDEGGIFPLHTWLPEAHPAAPAHVSAFMSGVMIKRSVRYPARGLQHGGRSCHCGMVLFVVGIVTGLYGAFLAAVQNDMKRLLAYSSIENIGIILRFGAAAIGYTGGNTFMSLCALSGALLHTLNHLL